ncbi:MAG: HD domain-containing phosphohydrolase, partial [bacterium]
MSDAMKILGQKLLEQTFELESLRKAANENVEEVREQLLRMEALAEASTMVNSTLELEPLLRLVVKLATRTLKAEAGSVFLKDKASGDLFFETTVGGSGETVKSVRVPRGEGIAGHVAETGEGVLVPDCSQDTRFFKGADEQSRFVTRNIVAAPLIARGETIGVIELINRHGGTFEPKDLMLLRALGHQSAVAIQNARLFQDVEDGFLATVQALAQAVDAKDNYTAGHSSRVAEYSALIATELGFEPEAAHRVHLAGLLHDVGKIGIKDAVLGKPGKLTDEEFAVMKTHPTVGGHILGPVPQLADVLPGIVCHHERFDGRGYPRGLKGEDIPLLGRIVAVADAFDAMTSSRVYRPRLPDAVVRAELQKNCGTQFDGHVVAAFLRILDRGLD